VGCPPALNEAQLLLRLYDASGLDMLGQLQGQFAFCLYDSKQVGRAGGWRPSPGRELLMCITRFPRAF
jgi:hypothetical protein